jgi:hypothetical protein
MYIHIYIHTRTYISPFALEFLHTFILLLAAEPHVRRARVPIPVGLNLNQKSNFDNLSTFDDKILTHRLQERPQIAEGSPEILLEGAFVVTVRQPGWIRGVPRS